MTSTRAEARTAPQATADDHAPVAVTGVSRWYGNVVAVNEITFRLDAGVTGLLAELLFLPAVIAVTAPERWLGRSLTAPLVDSSPAALSSVPEIVAVLARDSEKSMPGISIESPMLTNCASPAIGVPGWYERV